MFCVTAHDDIASLEKDGHELKQRAQEKRHHTEMLKMQADDRLKQERMVKAEKEAFIKHADQRSQGFREQRSLIAAVFSAQLTAVKKSSAVSRSVKSDFNRALLDCNTNVKTCGKNGVFFVLVSFSLTLKLCAGKNVSNRKTCWVIVTHSLGFARDCCEQRSKFVKTRRLLSERISL